MRKHRITVAAVFCLATLLTIVAITSRDDQPTYGGRTLQYWLEVYEGRWATDADPEQGRQAENAVRHIGTNAIPWLLKWMAYEPRPWQSRLAHLIYRLPEPASSSSLLHSATYSGTRLNRSLLTSMGFQILGEEAGSAVPALTSHLDRTNSVDLRRNAAHALASIGKPGLHPLLKALSDTNYPNRNTVASAVFLMADLGADAAPALPILINCTQDADPALAAMAVQALGQLRIEPETVVPALTNAFAAADKDVRFWAVRAFTLWLTDEAKQAAPAFKTMLNDPDYRIREDASNILVQIAAEALTNASAH